MTDNVWIAKIIYFVKGIQEEYKQIGRAECDIRFEAIVVSAKAQLETGGIVGDMIETLAYTCVMCGNVEVKKEMINTTYPLTIRKEDKEEVVEIPYSTEAVTCLKCNHWWSDWSSRDEMIAIIKYLDSNPDANYSTPKSS